MTVFTMPAQPGQDRAPRPLPWRRMAWVTWRQHRATLISLPAVLAAVSVFLLVAGLKIHHDYAVLTACRPFRSAACQQLNATFNQTDWTIGNTVLIFMNLAPALLGAFAGARCWPASWRPVPSGTPGRRATAGSGGRSPSSPSSPWWSSP
jgi:hypothetical protein